MHEVWTLSEVSSNRVKEISTELLARGRALADSLDGKLCTVVMGHAIEKVDLDMLIAYGCDHVYVVDDPHLASFNCVQMSTVLVSLIHRHEPEVLLALATTTGRTLLPYTAVQVHSGLTADCTGLAIEEGTGNLLQTRPAIGGNIMATIKTPDHRPQMATIRPHSTPLPPYDGTRKGTIQYIEFAQEWAIGGTEVLGLTPFSDQALSIEEAEIVVSGGRGLRKQENFTLVEHLARQLGGQVGASRDAVDRGWISYPHQVGLSGKTISPKLYLALGISGAIQHLAGIKTAECIVAVNTDENAPILDLADFAIIGDLFAVVPELERQLSLRRNA